VITGTVTDDGVPTVVLEVAGQSLLAVIDTGFNGDLELPEDLLPHVNARYIGRMTSALAAGHRVEEDVYLVDFPFDGETVHAEATFVKNGEILIGTGMLRQFRLEIHFPAGTVLIEAD
jgi:clan AA aspartic protease